MTSKLSGPCRGGIRLPMRSLLRFNRLAFVAGLTSLASSASAAPINIVLSESGLVTLGGVVLACPTPNPNNPASVNNPPTCTIPLPAGDGVPGGGFDVLFNEPGGGTSDVLRIRNAGAGFTLQFFSDPDAQPAEGKGLDYGLPTGFTNPTNVDEMGVEAGDKDTTAYNFNTDFGTVVNFQGSETPEPRAFLLSAIGLTGLLFLGLLRNRKRGLQAMGTAAQLQKN